VLVTGATGTGKTYVACALAQQACSKGYRAIYRRASKLSPELALADGTYTRVLAKLARADVLVLDDWAMNAITDVERRDLLEILDDRYGSRSTIVTSQVPPKKWHAHIHESRRWLSRHDRLRRPRHTRSGRAHEAGAREGPGIVLANCWAPVYRRFAEAKPDHPAEKALAWIGALYEFDRRGEGDLDRLAELRHTESVRVLDELKEWLSSMITLTSLSIGKAAAYTLRNWPKLIRFVDDARIPLDNNANERGIRGPVVSAAITSVPSRAAAPRSQPRSTPSSRLRSSTISIPRRTSTRRSSLRIAASF